MRLRGVEFGTVQNASGAQGFWGETANFNWGTNGDEVNWSGSTFVTKTITLLPHKGNLLVKEDGITPLEAYPSCIYVNRELKYAVNAVGLTGPGIKAVLETGRWQNLKQPFFISFMAVAETAQLRLEETREFVGILKRAKGNFNCPFGLQINFSCPNTDLEIGMLVAEVEQSLEICAQLDVALVPKVNLSVPIERMQQIMQSPNCDALYLTNSIPWKELFGNSKSPLDRFGGGGLSGKPLFAPLLARVQVLKDRAAKPIVAGGGIVAPEDAWLLLESGAAAVSLGSVSMYAPHQVQRIIAAVSVGQRETAS